MSRILIADDREASRELIHTILQADGHEVVDAVDGLDALDKARQLRPDLILLDLQMPSLDGFGVAAVLRSESAFAATPIVALTASAMSGDREKALELGFSAYITKPVRVNELRAQVLKLIVPR